LAMSQSGSAWVVTIPSHATATDLILQ
jgi:hypothetical protein